MQVEGNETTGKTSIAVQTEDGMHRHTEIIMEVPLVLALFINKTIADHLSLCLQSCSQKRMKLF